MDGVAAARIGHCLRTGGGLAYEGVRKWVGPAVDQVCADHEVVDYVQDVRMVSVPWNWEENARSEAAE